MTAKIFQNISTKIKKETSRKQLDKPSLVAAKLPYLRPIIYLLLVLLIVAQPDNCSAAPLFNANANTSYNKKTNVNNHNNGFWAPSRRFLFRQREVPLDSFELPSLRRRRRKSKNDKLTIVEIPSLPPIIIPTMTTATTTPTTARDVIWFVPNLIGYARVACALTAFVLMACQPTYWVLATLLYLGSFVGDLFDGWAARKLDQCSVMGGLLDMITDRCATLGFLYFLGGEYAAVDARLSFPFFRLLFMSLMILDISSHWCQMYSASLVKDGAHHKSEAGNQGRHFLVQWFYKYYWFFGYLCVGAEFTYICLYVIQHATATGILYRAALYLLYLCIPGCAAKQLVNLMQLLSACHIVAQHDAKERNNNNKQKQQLTGKDQ